MKYTPYFKIKDMITIEFTKDWKRGSKKKGDIIAINGMIASDIIKMGLAKKRVRKTKKD